MYGAHFATKDLDVCHARELENLEILCGLLRCFDAQFRRMPRSAPAEVTPATLCTETDFVFTTTRGDVDLIGEFTAVGGYDQACEDAAAFNLSGIDIPVLALHKLIAAKISTCRPKDLAVSAELKLIQRAMMIAHPARHPQTQPALIRSA